MLKYFESGTMVGMDETPSKLNTLRRIGTTLPFDSFVIFLKFDKHSYFDNDRYYLLGKDFSKTEVTETYVKTLAKNEEILLLNQSQFKHLVELAIKDNEGVARLTKNVCELLFKIGFMTEKEFLSIKYIKE